MKKLSQTEQLEAIKEEIINLKSSPLYSHRIEHKNVPVIGEGNSDATIMFIGEAPGKNEAQTGKPFFGKSGKVLDHLLTSIGIKREEVYITNIVKDRPPGNRDPLPEEIMMYAPFLDRQITIIKPTVIATLGRFSMAYVMKKFGFEDQLSSISDLHGRVFESKSEDGVVYIVPLYHPAVAVYNSNKIGELKKDFEVLKNYLT
jgi:DNA polymerase